MYEMLAFPAPVAAYSKEISNESYREASKTLITRSRSVLRAKRISQQKFGSNFFVLPAKTSRHD